MAYRSVTTRALTQRINRLLAKKGVVTRAQGKGKVIKRPRFEVRSDYHHGFYLLDNSKGIVAEEFDGIEALARFARSIGLLHPHEELMKTPTMAEALRPRR